MYRTKNEFVAAVNACNPPYSDAELKSIDVAWAVYQAAQATNLKLLILGRWVEPSTEGAPGIDNILRQNLVIMNEVDTGGSVMKTNNWTVLVNDAWLLGGVHSHTRFYLASPRTPNNIYNNDQNHRLYRQLTVTGRELTGLSVFGYDIRRGHPTLGEIAVCVDTALADAASFATYRPQIANYTNSEQLRTRLFAPEYGGPAVVNWPQAKL